MALVIFGTLSLPVYAAVGIPQYLIPKDTPLRELNKNISDKALEKDDAAVTGANLVLQFIANALLYVAAPLAILFVAHGGQGYAFAFGEQGKMDAAKREILWALLGLGTILVSYIAVRMIIGSFLGLNVS